MKIIISHDVDHITAWEHGKDFIIPKHLIRSFIELSENRISFKELISRFGDIIRNKWNNLEELMEFDKAQEVPSTFFFGIKKGKYLSYDVEKVKFWSEKAIKQGFFVGVHGISFEEYIDIKFEHDSFALLTKQASLGIRMHYLRRNNDTLANLARAGYKYDSTVQKLAPPYKFMDLWEFPLHIMDGDIFCKNKRWQDQGFSQAKEQSKKILDQAEKAGVGYFTLLLHDRYFGDSFPDWRDWYIWTIEYAKKNGYQFTDYNKAIKELENNGSGN